MSADQTIWSQPGFKEAFATGERQERLRSGKVACALVVFLMPAGITLDLFVYPDRWVYFLQLRLFSSALAGALWFVHTRPFGQRYYHYLGIPIAIIPAYFIAWMIAVTEGPLSPYYAGLILILLAVNAVVHWSTTESCIAIAVLLLLYIGACLPWNLQAATGSFFNNIYFLVLTGIIVVVGNHLYNRLRFREFALRFELDQSRKQLEKSNRKLVELDEIKSRFFANISHELRTPLTLLLAPLESLIKERGSSLDPKIQELLVMMQSNGLRLLKLINDLLDLVRLESGKMEVKREPVAMEPFLRGLGNAISKTAEDRGVRLETTVDAGLATALTDSDKLEKILLNLLFNALKFTPAGGLVQLNASRQNGRMVLAVSDTGVGISDEKMAYVFDRFWQADTSSQRKNQGVGIGLALVKELVEVQGGTVGVSSEVGRGSTFTVSLPYSEPEHRVLTTSPTTKSLTEPQTSRIVSDAKGVDGTWLENLYRQAKLVPPMKPLRELLPAMEFFNSNGPPRLLVADDEPDMLRYLKSQLGQNFQVIEAADGQQAVDKACQFLPDVILCDMMMPGKDGLEVCRDLRQRTSTQTIPILMLTARADEETKLAVLSAGADDFVTKPFSMTELNVRLKNLVEAHHLQQELGRKNQILEATLEQLKEMEGQLVHSEKLASLGRMSAGIIHEINNPLNFSKTGLFTLKRMAESLAESEKAEFLDVLQDMEGGLNRIIHIVSDLRTFTRSDVTEFESVPVVKIVESALRFLSHEWRDKVHIDKDIPEGQTIWANRNQTTQVLVNLLQNALDTLRSKSFNGAQPTIWVRGMEVDGGTVITLRDNGEGIPAENLPKIFDPFFTTKEVGAGMGLGLSICYRIMQQHGGRIDVSSERGQYSEFKLLFPHRENIEAEVAAA
ncbi:MAG: ATP-binding protein [Deltaproteobacteria bacterium]|nr:ATP-binding protein [Deltaproteobacteria bacterium]